jgi:hypothetical protein
MFAMYIILIWIDATNYYVMHILDDFLKTNFKNLIIFIFLGMDLYFTY